jgi:hypothetical protein
LTIEKENWVNEKNEDEDEDIELADGVADGVKGLDVKDAPPLNSVNSSTSAEAAEEDEEIL